MYMQAINAGLQSLKAGRGILGKVAVIVDRDLAMFTGPYGVSEHET